MARFCARVRKRADLPSVSMPDIYKHPTIRSLAAALANTNTDTKPTPASQPATPAALIEPPRRASNGEYVLCGALQLLFLLGYPALTATVAVKGYEWVSAGPDLVDIYLRSVVYRRRDVPRPVHPSDPAQVGAHRPVEASADPGLEHGVLPLLARQDPGPAQPDGAVRRFTALRALPEGTGREGRARRRHPLQARARVHRPAQHRRRRGDPEGLVLQRLPGRTTASSRRARSTSARTRWSARRRCSTSGRSLGDGAQLGHSSSLHAGQTVPDGERWHGSPAQPTDVDYRRVPTMDVSTWRRVVFATVQLVNLLLLGTPLAYRHRGPRAHEGPAARRAAGPGTGRLHELDVLRDALVISAVLFFGAVLVGLVFVGTVPRVLNLFITPDKVYPLYGFHYWVQRAIARTTNSRFYMRLFGDTSYVVHYLRWLGYDLRGVRQTGSNFGEVVKHDTPFLTAVGSGTMVADGLSIINADFSNTSFRLSRVSIGAENFLGNRIAYPAQAKTGDNCLLATKVMVPLDGQVREGVGLLGAPSFEIPRSVKRDKQLDVRSADELRRGLMGQEHPQHRHPGADAAVAVDPLLRRHRALPGRPRPLGLPGCARVRDWPPSGSSSSPSPTTSWSTGWSGRSWPCGRRAARSTTAPSGGTNASGRCASITYLDAFNGTPIKTRALAAVGCADRPPGLRRRRRHARADVHHDR